MSDFSISLLDLGILAPAQLGRDILAQTFRTARLADQLGYQRFWLAEHHEAHFSWAAPEIIIAALSQTTQRIGLGSAAVLLPLYSPLAVAENYRGLSALARGRIALGVCGGVPADTIALAGLSGTDLPAATITQQFANKLAELVRYLHGDFPAQHRFANCATPCDADPPALWVMGSGFGTAELAAKSAAGYAYSLFHRASTQDAAIPQAYRQHYQHYQAAQGNPEVAIALSCICADSIAEAEQQKQRVETWLGGSMRVNIVGTPQTCRDELLSIQEKYTANQLIIYHMWHLEQAKHAAISALAELFELTAI